MSVNRGKQLEVQVRKGLERVEGVSFDRFIDPTSGFKGICNVCDFVAYKYPTIFYIECKSCSCNTLSWSNITDNQWRGLVEKDKIKGVVAGFLIWYVECDRTIFVPATDAQRLRNTQYKSINVCMLDKQFKDKHYFDVRAEKKRVLFDYDMDTLLNDLQKYEVWRIRHEQYI